MKIIRRPIGDGTQDEVIFIVRHNEPIFMLRGQDVTFADAVTGWADLADHAGAPLAKTREARIFAQEGADWRNAGKCKVPD